MENKYGVWEREEYTVIEKDFDADLHKFEVYIKDDMVAIIYPESVDQMKEDITKLNKGEGIEDWEDGRGNPIDIQNALKLDSWERKAMAYVLKKDINFTETNEWIDLIRDLIKEFDLESTIVDSEEGYAIIVDEDDKRLLENVLYYVENTETTLEYIFEGKVFNLENFPVEITGDTIRIYDRNANEIVGWIDDEWAEDPSITIFIANAIATFYEMGEDGLRQKLSFFYKQTNVETN